MRLSTRERQALRAIMGELDPAGCLYLYGSRADDARRSGDIAVQPIHPIAMEQGVTTFLQRKGFVAP